MKTRIAVPIAVVFVVAIAVCAECRAIFIRSFEDTDSFIKRSSDIVVARCVPEPKGGPLTLWGELHPADFEVLMTLKGEQNRGPLKVFTVYEMKPGTVYLLAHTGGPGFRAAGELSAVPLPANFEFAVLKGMSTKQQVQRLFAARLFEVQQKLAPLEAERNLLLKGLHARSDDLYESRGDVHITTIHETSTQELNWMRYYFELGAAKLGWSPQSPGESGYLDYHWTGKEPVTWEFAAAPQREIKDFDGKPLAARFYGDISPVLDSAPPGSKNSVVKVGQVVLARTTADPRTVYILKVESQATDKESVTVKYAVVRD
jgi:hypothetical protein